MEIQEDTEMPAGPDSHNASHPHSEYRASEGDSEEVGQPGLIPIRQRSPRLRGRKDFRRVLSDSCSGRSDTSSKGVIITAI